VLDEFIVDKADAVTGAYGQDLTVAFTLRYHGAIRLSESFVRLSKCAKSREFSMQIPFCAVALQQPAHSKVTTIVENVET
jgi:hypothetical protein